MKKITKIFLFGLLISQPAFALADFEIKSWEYRAKINIRQPEEYVVLDLPSTAFEKLKPSLGDLRVVNLSDGVEEVPYTIAVEEEKNFVRDLPARMYNLGTVLGVSTSFELDLGRSGLLHSQVAIETASENFKRGVEVYGSDDGKSWILLNGKGQIFDFTNREGGYLQARYADVKYPESTLRYLKVVVGDAGEAPLNITGAKVRREVREVAREILYDPTFEVIQNGKDKTTDVIIDLEVDGTPTSGGELNIKSELFSRGVIIYASSDRTSWSVIGSGYIFSIDTPKFRGSNLKFFYPESRKRYLKISILNKDDKPMSVDGVALSGVARRILFKYAPGGNYYLYLGNADARSPQYDIEKFSGYLVDENVGKTDMGEVEKNDKFVPKKLPLTEEYPYLLNISLVIVVLILGALAVRLFTSVK